MQVSISCEQPCSIDCIYFEAKYGYRSTKTFTLKQLLLEVTY